MEPIVENTAKDILKGAKTSDVARTNGLSDSICREYLHKYCKTVNRSAYEALAVEAVNQGHSTPPKWMLQQQKAEFLKEQPVCRPLTEVEKELASVSADCDNLERLYRSRNCARAQLRRELSELKRMAND